jgi:hypothetical protein
MEAMRAWRASSSLGAADDSTRCLKLLKSAAPD